jgi:urease accessory protein
VKEPASNAVASNALQGRLDLAAARLDDGRTSIVRQYHTVPFHVGKAYWDGAVLMAQVVNPTAGIFAGDRMESLVEVGPGASLAVASPSAARAHTMTGGGSAKLDQRFRVARDGWLEVAPELFIPQRASSYRQSTEVEVEEGGSLYFVETLAPGRVAHGESFAYARLDWTFSLRVAGRLVALERALVEPPGECWMLDVAGWDHAYYACVWMAGPALADLDSALIERIEATGEDEPCLVGMSKTAGDCHSVKILAGNSIVLRRALATVRGHMSCLFPFLARNLRKSV